MGVTDGQLTVNIPSTNNNSGYRVYIKKGKGKGLTF